MQVYRSFFLVGARSAFHITAADYGTAINTLHLTGCKTQTSNNLTERERGRKIKRRKRRLAERSREGETDEVRGKREERVSAGP